MSKLAHSNQETMDKIERDASERDERGEPDEPRSSRIPNTAGSGSVAMSDDIRPDGREGQPDAGARSCATCGAILAPGPQPAATYEPGPWRISPRAEEEMLPKVETKSGHAVAVVGSISNARLIAAAPEMLVALNLGLQVVQNYWPQCEPENEPEKSTLEFINAARNAIYGATGSFP